MNISVTDLAEHTMPVLNVGINELLYTCRAFTNIFLNPSWNKSPLPNDREKCSPKFCTCCDLLAPQLQAWYTHFLYHSSHVTNGHSLFSLSLWSVLSIQGLFWVWKKVEIDGWLGWVPLCCPRTRLLELKWDSWPPRIFFCGLTAGWPWRGPCWDL